MSIIRNFIVLGFLLSMVSCATKRQLAAPKPMVDIPSPRYSRYFECVVRLNREGIQQSLIKTLCDSTHGMLSAPISKGSLQ